jgi:hypothetical protein
MISRWFFPQLIFSTLKMEAICSSEMSVDTQRTTRRYIPEDGTLHNHRCENLRKRLIALLATCIHSGFLLGLYFDREDGGDMFLRNFG